MIHVEADKSKQLLMMSFSERVGKDEMINCVEQTRSSLVDMRPGFRLLTDLSNLEFMDSACADYIGQIMDLCDAKGVHAIARVVPDSKKDIGFNIMSLFHHGSGVHTMTHESLVDAIQSLSA